MSADERRESVLDAAVIEFGQNGFGAATTDAIAKRVGVSQPYLFRLFPSKKAIFVAAMERCFSSIENLFYDATEGVPPDQAMMAMGAAYNGLLENREILQMQLQMWALACQDEEVRALARRGMSRLWTLAQKLSGADDQRVMQFMANGMLLNVFAAMDLPRIKEHLGDSLQGL
jgi:AcrR family transcriptional regulator